MENLLKQALSAPRGSIAQNEAIALIATEFEQLKERVDVLEAYQGEQK